MLEPINTFIGTAPTSLWVNDVLTCSKQHCECLAMLWVESCGLGVVMADVQVIVDERAEY